MPSKIDPRWVTTPLGAVVGTVLAKKVLAKEDQSVRNLAIGAGVGGGAGFLAGSMLKAEPSILRSSSSGDPDKIYQDFVQGRNPTGMRSH